MSKIPFSELSTAAYCPRKLYYQRRNEIEVPEAVAERREIAFQYGDLLGEADQPPTNADESLLGDSPGTAVSDERLADLPLAVGPAEFRSNLDRVRRRFTDEWPHLRDPEDRERLVEGKDSRGIVHKVLGLDPPTPSMVFTGDPPEQGVWEPQSVRAVAAAKALSWEAERPVERAFVEYPTHGIVREIELTVRRKAAYRTAIETVRSLDGPPPRLRGNAKCEPCEYREECGVKTRSVKSLLGL
jgi:CRISPR-associated exonuclease Cas4